MISRYGHRHAGLPSFAPRNARRFGSLFNPPSPPELPPAPSPPSPAPSAENPEIEDARRRRQLAEARRRGRRATILTGGGGDDSPADVERPRLRSLLGGG